MKLSRFAAASAAGLALAIPGVSVWAQDTPAPAVAAPTIDPAARALLAEVDKKTASVRSLSAQTLTITSGSRGEMRTSGYIQALRPNYLRAVMQPLKQEAGKWVPSGAKMVNASDGKSFFMLAGGDTYRKMPAAPNGANVEPGVFLPMFGFFAPEVSSFTALAQRFGEQNRLGGLTLSGKEMWMGVEYDRVQMNLTANSKVTLMLYVGPDKLIHRVVENTESARGKSTTDYQFLNLKPGAPLAPARFAYTPPKGMKRFVESERPALLAVGTPAPDFTAKGKDGPVKLSDLRGKVVVLDFWATWCGPCISSFPHTGEVAKKMGDKAVVFALNVWDEEAAYNEWLPKNTQYSHFVFAIDPQEGGQDVARKLYKVSGIPTQYVIDKNGIVRAALVGFGGATDALEKAIDAADNAGK